MLTNRLEVTKPEVKNSKIDQIDPVLRLEKITSHGHTIEKGKKTRICMGVINFCNRGKIEKIARERDLHTFVWRLEPQG